MLEEFKYDIEGDQEDYSQEIRADFLFADNGRGHSLQQLPTITAILNAWIKQDFDGSTANLLAAFHLEPDDFCNISHSLGYENKHKDRQDLFADAVGGMYRIGNNLTRLFNKFIPDNLFTKGYYFAGKSYLDIHSFSTLKFFQNKIKRSDKTERLRQIIDISDDTLAEKLDLALKNKAIINKNQTAKPDDIIAFRALLNERIDHLYNSMKQSIPAHEQKAFTKSSLIHQIVEETNTLHPWKLFGYAPLEKRQRNGAFVTANRNGEKYIRYDYLNTNDFVNALSKCLYSLNEKDSAERAAFFEVASKVLGKHVQYDIENAFLNGPKVPLGDMYKYKRKSQGKSQQDIVDDIEGNIEIGEIERGERLNLGTLQALNVYFKFDKNTNILNKLNTDIAELNAEHKEKSKRTKLKRLFEKEFNKTTASDRNRSGFLLKKWRLLTLKKSLNDMSNMLNYSKTYFLQLENGKTTLTIPHIDEICASLTKDMDQGPVQKIRDAIKDEAFKREGQSSENNNKARVLFAVWQKSILDRSQKEIAEILNISNSIFKELETIDGKLTISKIDKICKHLKQTHDYLHVQKIKNAIKHEALERIAPCVHDRSKAHILFQVWRASILGRSRINVARTLKAAAKTIKKMEEDEGYLTNEHMQSICKALNVDMNNSHVQEILDAIKNRPCPNNQERGNSTEPLSDISL